MGRPGAASRAGKKYLCRSGLWRSSTIRNCKEVGCCGLRAAHRRRELTAKSTNSPNRLDHAGFVEVDLHAEHTDQYHAGDAVDRSL
jgi:hypothetical protein